MILHVQPVSHWCCECCFIVKDLYQSGLPFVPHGSWRFLLDWPVPRAMPCVAVLTSDCPFFDCVTLDIHDVRYKEYSKVNTASVDICQISFVHKWSSVNSSMMVISPSLAGCGIQYEFTATDELQVCKDSQIAVIQFGQRIAWLYRL
jgi:hypothetical protein